MLVGLGPLALALFALPGSLRRRGFGIEQRFLILWIATPVLFYTLVHFGQAGYVLTFLPALVILLAHALVESLAAGSMRLRRPHWRFAVTCAALVALVFLNTAFFVSARPIPLDFSKPEADGWGVKLRGEVHQWIMSRTAAALREHEAVIRTYVDVDPPDVRPGHHCADHRDGQPALVSVAAPRDVLSARVPDLPALARPGAARLLRPAVVGHDDPHAREPRSPCPAG